MIVAVADSVLKSTTEFVTDTCSPEDTSISLSVGSANRAIGSSGLTCPSWFESIQKKMVSEPGSTPVREKVKVDVSAATKIFGQAAMSPPAGRPMHTTTSTVVGSLTNVVNRLTLPLTETV